MSNVQDPVRDLMNLLQGQYPSLVHYLMWTNNQIGPENQAWHRGQYTFGGVVIGVGEGGAINHAKHYAAIQALQYFVTHPPVSILQSLGILQGIQTPVDDKECVRSNTLH